MPRCNHIDVRTRRDSARAPATVDGLIVRLITDVIGRGVRDVSVRLEGRCASIATDAPGSFDRFLTNDTVAARMALEICDGYRRQSAIIAGGHMLGPVRDHGPTHKRSTRLSLIPDPDVFGDAHFDPETIRRYLEGVSVGRPDVRLRIDGERLVRTLSELVSRVAGSEVLMPRPLRIAGQRYGVQADVALQWRAEPTDPVLRVYGANRSGVAARDADDSIRQALFDGLLDAARRPDIDDRVVAELLEPGLVAVIALSSPAAKIDVLDDIGADVPAAVCAVTREGLIAHRRPLHRILAGRSRSRLS